MSNDQIIHKTNRNSKVVDEPPEIEPHETWWPDNDVFTLEQANTIVEVIVELRAEFTDALAQAVQKFEVALDKLRDEMELREAVAEQRGQLKTMMSALGVEPIDMSAMVRKLRTRLHADIQDMVKKAIAPLSERVAALKEEQMSFMPLEFHEAVDKTVAALRERIATLERQLAMLVSVLKGENVDEGDGLKQIDCWPITLFEIDDQR